MKKSIRLYIRYTMEELLAGTILEKLETIKKRRQERIQNMTKYVATLEKQLDDFENLGRKMDMLYELETGYTLKPGIKINLKSDLHVEFWVAEQVDEFIEQETPGDFDILILAGDIGNPTIPTFEQLLRGLTCKWGEKPIIYVAGNHEYYSGNVEDMGNMIVDITSQYPTIHYLNRSSIMINGIRFLGCTLWTPCNNPELAMMINDYKSIKDFTPAICNMMHDTDREWLQSQLDVEFSGKTIVVTHHLPTRQLADEKYKDHPLNDFYMNDLDHMCRTVDLWCCGHTHHAKCITVDNCTCVVNPLGYEDEDSDFDPHYTIII